jgi:hypothetical protein
MNEPKVVRRNPRFAKWTPPQRYSNTDPWKEIPWAEDIPPMTVGGVLEWVLVVVALAALLVMTGSAFG